jgi:hypothetical protein
VDARAVDAEKFGDCHSGAHLGSAGVDARDLPGVAGLDAQARLE